MENSISAYEKWRWTFTLCHIKITQNVSDLNVRPKPIKLLEENIGEKLCNSGFSNDFLAMSPKAQATKEKIAKTNFMKIFFKNCASKETE